MNKHCRFCQKPLLHSFCDLETTPLSNSFLTQNDLIKKESFYPLRAYVCDQCFLVQLEEFEKPEHIFSDYAYFSSYSDSWLVHMQTYAETMIHRWSLSPSSQVIEIASNDGYLLQFFQKKKIPTLGIEPAMNVAEAAQKKGIPTLTVFFSTQTALDLLHKGTKADLLIANNVLAHVPNLNDFVEGMKLILKSEGVITVEFPHLLQLMMHNQFDTIYHEHFSYFSFRTVEQVFAKHGLTLFDVEELPTHGGSLRIYACHHDHCKPISSNVIRLKEKENSYGLNQLSSYLTFAEKVKKTRQTLVDSLTNLRKQGKSIMGYGAPAKGNTLLNYCKIGKELISCTVDRSLYKQGRFLPGTRIPIKPLDEIEKQKPDYLLILPWNLKEEIMLQMNHIRKWGGKFIVPIPTVEVIS